MEFIAIFCILTALAFVLWLMAVVALFLIKVAVGTTGILYYAVKGFADILLRILIKIVRILHLESIFNTQKKKLPLRE